MGRPVRHGSSKHPRGGGNPRSTSRPRDSQRSSGRSNSRDRQRSDNRSHNSRAFGRSQDRTSRKDGKFTRHQENTSFSKEFAETKQPGLYSQGRTFLTKSMKPGKKYFDLEKEHTIKGDAYREVDPKRSKFVAAIAKGLQQTGMKEDSTVLYLGASHGYTPSFFSDIVSKGMIFCLDFAPRVVRDLYFICEDRDNMAPILASAATPDDYKDIVPEVDVVFQDIAQRNQVEIFLKNCDMFLAKGGFGMVAIKARSIDVAAKPKDIFKKLRQELEENPAYTVIEYRELDPFEQDHAFFVVRKK